MPILGRWPRALSMITSLFYAVDPFGTELACTLGGWYWYNESNEWLNENHKPNLFLNWISTLTYYEMLVKYIMSPISYLLSQVSYLRSHLSYL